MEEPDISEAFGTRPGALRPCSPLITNVYGRDTRSLNGDWNIIVDEHRIGGGGLFGGSYYDLPRELSGMELVEHGFDPDCQLRVPGDWNTQDDTLFRYRGVVWYQRNFTIQKETGARYFLHFDGVNYAANVYLNGTPVAGHEGGYVAFNVELTEALLDGDNFLVVEVDAELGESTVPTLRTSDFFKYGGITRDVSLVTVAQTFISQYHLYLADLANHTVAGWVQLDGPAVAGVEVSIKLPESGITINAEADAAGRAEFSFSTELDLWSPESPRLHSVEISTGCDQVSDRIGFRSIETHGEQILLNGEPVYLRGISLHDESVLKPGVAFEEADAKAQLELARELNANFLRLSHYPHNEHTVRLADKLGFMVWSETPIVSVIDWGNENTFKLARRQLTDNLCRDLNRACVITWSIANEGVPRTPERLEFLRTLAADARALDKSKRPLSAALIGDPAREFMEVIQRLILEMLADPEVKGTPDQPALEAFADAGIEGDRETIRQGEMTVTLDDELGEIIDIVGYNEYFGWYYSAGIAPRLGVSEGLVRRHMLALMPHIRFRSVFGKPIIISEFGAGARKGYVSPYGEGALWTEAYQARVYEAQLKMLSRSSAVQGMSPWILKDFRSARRQLHGIQGGYNRKGLVSESGEKKQAFGVLQKHYHDLAAR